MKKFIFILLVLFSTNLFAIENKIIAQVGKEVITESDLNKRLNMFLILNEIKASKEQIIEIKKQLLENLIDEHIFRQQAKKNNLTVSEKEINSAIENLENMNKLPKGHLLSYLKEKKIDSSEFIKQLESQLIWHKIIGIKFKDKVNVSQKEIDQMIETRGNKNMQVSLTRVISANEENKILLEEIKKKYSTCQDIEKIKNEPRYKKIILDNLEVKIIDLNDKIRNKIRHLDDNKPSDIFKTENTWQFFIVCKRSLLEVNPNEKEEVKGIILDHKIGMYANHYLDELRKQTFIEIK